jgi:predicted choloylglycine hydrolase
MIVDMSFQTAEITNNFDDWKKNCEEFDNSVREVKETYRKYKQGKK